MEIHAKSLHTHTLLNEFNTHIYFILMKYFFEKFNIHFGYSILKSD
jgi:hypothetical protein